MAEDFQFLNSVTSGAQTGISTNLRKFNRQTDNLSDVLQGVHQQVKTVDTKKAQSDFFFKAQSDKLAQASDKTVLEVAQARADPFHTLKVLFTDEKSIDDLVVQQHKIQNEMNIVNRRFAGAATEYNTELSLIQSELTNAAQQRSLTKEQLGVNIQAAAGLTTAVNTKVQVVQQQLNEMTLAEMKAEFANPTLPDLPRGTLQNAILAKEALMAKLATDRSTKGKSQLEIMAKLFDTVAEHPEMVDRNQLVFSVDQGKPISVFGVPIQPNQAQKILELQDKSRDETSGLLAEMAVRSTSAAASLSNVQARLIRANGGGSDLIVVDPITNRVTGLDTTMMPDIEGKLYKQMEKEGSFIQLLQTSLSTMQPTDPAYQAQSKLLLGMQAKIVDTETDLKTLTSARAADKYVDKAAKASAAQFNEMGFITSPEGAIAIGAELAGSLTSTAVTAETFGAGYSAGMKTTMLIIDRKLKEYASLNPDVQGETEELDTQSLIAKMFSTNRQQDLKDIYRAALKETNARGDNAVGEVIIQDWLEVGTARGLNHMINTVHVDDPASQDVLRSLLSSESTLVGQITQANDGFSTMFALLRLKERKAIADDKLSENSNLVSELQTMMLREKTYQQPWMQDLTNPLKDGAAHLNKLVFDNQSAAVFMQSMMQQVSSIPLDNLDEALDAAAGPGSLLGRATSGAVDFITGSGTRRAIGAGLDVIGIGIDEIVDDNRPVKRSIFDAAKAVLENNPELAPQKK